ncbi:hypothetical protein L1987_32197 [Smallanthus sonchifolius]|uniref:Uncharacterized protein n=1 Tax=Smallanthus sonchifolius TaxID=185202 RepID=A0ACB9I7P8_9ASTR|nr:hypothetical protein L1987_32197 [Smallanthus sonchifolius]
MGILNPHDHIMGKTLTCVASVTEIVTDKNGYNNACPDCLQTVYESGEKWACPSHEKHDNSRHLFCVVVNTTDDTGSHQNAPNNS